MQPNIHPKYDEISVTCSCGHTFKTRSTRQGALSLEVCNQCHPFNTGQQKFASAGRVETFNSKYASLSGRTTTKKQK